MTPSSLFPIEPTAGPIPRHLPLSTHARLHDDRPHPARCLAPAAGND